MIIKKNICFIFVFFILLSTSYSQIQNENYPIFKLATTPFIHKSDLALSVSYGLNYGNPSLNIDDWILPNESKNILFDYSEIRFSFANKFSLFAGYSKMFLTVYNEPTNVHDYTDDKFKFGAKMKLIKAKGYYPAFSIEFNTDYAVSLSIGSTVQKFKYYLTVDCNTIGYILPVPILLSSGIAYEVINDFNLFVEGSFNRIHGGTAATQSFRTGINHSFLKYLNFDVGLFYFGYDYDYIVPGGLSRKDKYYLLSGSVTLDFSLIEN